MARGGLTTIANRGLPSMMPGEHSGNELAAAADTELVECRSQVFLNGVGRYMQFPDDLAGGVSPDDQGDDTGLRGGQTMGVQQQGADLRRGSGFDHDADLRRGRTAQAGGVQGQPHSGAAAKPDRGRRLRSSGTTFKPHQPGGGGINGNGQLARARPAGAARP
jgi:hypothetical protein